MEMDVKSSIGMWDVAREALSRLADAPKDRAAVLALSGELGAGKTTFTQALAGVLGAAGPVQSPTYVILKKHQLKGGRWHTLAHIDAYRLGGADDLAAIGWAELVADPGVLVVIEWPERVLAALPEGALWLRFSHETLETRKVTVG